MRTSIPFSGFYESIHSDNLDDAIASIFSDESGDPYGSLVSLTHEHVDWQKVFLEYSQAYVAGFKAYFNIPSLTFTELSSPREYNFTTDRIFCEIDLADVKRIFAAVPRNILEKKIKDTFTSRSGFISFYPSTLDEWPSNICDWDLNHVGTLLAAYISTEDVDPFSQNSESDLLGDPLSEVTEPMIEKELTKEASTRLYKLLDYLRTREQRK